ncbi:dimethylsulfonioproprionate lyase family protein [Pelagibius marinus]|uniref:dimethylsulfonioproprionate lyase family protein n=1 Tax=Pelagibius marinus TaxID=2762760 RepID=UPI0029CA48F0|nr:cupin domain-containing protein [Pelagibius marinus]
MTGTGGVTMQWLMEDAITPDAGLSLARMTVAPGVTSQAHRHSDCSEAVHLLEGSVAQRRGDDWVPLAAGETLLIPPGAVHQTRNTGPETAVLMVAYSSGARIYDPVE